MRFPEISGWSFLEIKNYQKILSELGDRAFLASCFCRFKNDKTLIRKYMKIFPKTSNFKKFVLHQFSTDFDNFWFFEKVCVYTWQEKYIRMILTTLETPNRVNPAICASGFCRFKTDKLEMLDLRAQTIFFDNFWFFEKFSPRSLGISFFIAILPITAKMFTDSDHPPREAGLIWDAFISRWKKKRKSNWQFRFS